MIHHDSNHISFIQNQTASCALCSKTLDASPTVRLRDKGCSSINKASLDRKLNVRVSEGQEVHIDCRRNFTNKRHNVSAVGNTKLSSTRLTSNKFEFKSKCLFCTEFAKLSNKKRGSDVFPVRTIDFQDNILEICTKRNDTWAREVSERIAQVIDLPAASILAMPTVDWRCQYSTYRMGMANQERDVYPNHDKSSRCP